MTDGGNFVSGVASLGSQPACKRGDPMNKCCSFTRQPPSSQPATLSDWLYLATWKGPECTCIATRRHALAARSVQRLLLLVVAAYVRPHAAAAAHTKSAFAVSERLARFVGSVNEWMLMELARQLANWGRMDRSSAQAVEARREEGMQSCSELGIPTGTACCY